MPYLDQDKAKEFSKGLMGNTGMSGIKKMFGMDNSNPMSDALKKRQAKLNEMKMDYNDGSTSQY